MESNYIDMYVFRIYFAITEDSAEMHICVIPSNIENPSLYFAPSIINAVFG